MATKQNSFSLWIAIYALGVVFSLTLSVLATWSSLEAAFYGFSRRADTPLTSLRCPILLNRSETGAVLVKISNTTDRALSPTVRAEFSTPETLLSTFDTINLAPGESKTMKWKIGPENIDLERFIFSKVLVFASYPIPDRESTCGTFIIDLPVPGNVAVYLLIGFGLLGLGVSLFSLRRLRVDDERVQRVMSHLIFLALVVVVGLVVSLLRWWLQGILLLTVSVILIVAALRYLVFK